MMRIIFTAAVMGLLVFMESDIHGVPAHSYDRSATEALSGFQPLLQFLRSSD